MRLGKRGEAPRVVGFEFGPAAAAAPPVAPVERAPERAPEPVPEPVREPVRELVPALAGADAYPPPEWPPPAWPAPAPAAPPPVLPGYFAPASTDAPPAAEAAWQPSRWQPEEPPVPATPAPTGRRRLLGGGKVSATLVVFLLFAALRGYRVYRAVTDDGPRAFGPPSSIAGEGRLPADAVVTAGYNAMPPGFAGRTMFVAAYGNGTPSFYVTAAHAGGTSANVYRLLQAHAANLGYVLDVPRELGGVTCAMLSSPSGGGSPLCYWAGKQSVGFVTVRFEAGVAEVAAIARDARGAVQG